MLEAQAKEETKEVDEEIYICVKSLKLS